MVLSQNEKCTGFAPCTQGFRDMVQCSLASLKLELGLFVATTAISIALLIFTVPRLSSRLMAGPDEQSRSPATTTFALLVAALGVYWMTDLVNHQVFNTIMVRVKHDVRTAVFCGLLRHGDIQYYEPALGKNSVQVTNVPEDVVQVLQTFLNQVLPFTLILLAATLFFTVQHVLYFPLFLLFWLGLSATMVTCGRRTLESCTRREEGMYEVSETISHTFQNLLNVYISNGTEAAAEKTCEDLHTFHFGLTRSAMDECMYFAAASRAVCIVTFLATVGLTVYLKPKISLSKFRTLIIAVFTVMLFCLRTVSTFPSGLQKVGDITAGVRDIDSKFQDVAAAPQLVQSSEAHHVAFSFENVNFSYSAGSDNTCTPVAVLKNFTLSVGAGERVALTGPSGSGKSTVAKLLLKLFPVDGGTVSDNGQNIATLPTRWLRKTVCYVNQRSQLWDTSVLDNILYSNSPSAEPELHRLITEYSLGDVFNNLHGGLTGHAGPGGQHLSLGMVKVVMLLRAVLHAPTVQCFVFDEPTASLDITTADRVLKMLHRELSHHTVVFLTHCSSVVSICDRTVHM